jgi:hypothetical protein
MSDMKADPNVKLPQAAGSIKLPDVPGETVIVKTMTQIEIDQETSLVKLKTEKLRLQREQLELEKLTADIEKIRAERAQSAMSHETVEESLAYARKHDEINQNGCTHMKGGASEALLHGAISKGEDAGNYALIDHTFTTGVRFRLCQRCGKTWFPADPDYRWAMSRPTRNSPSSGCPSPGLVQDLNKPVERGGRRLVSEIPHKVAPPTDSPFGPGPAGY